MGSRFWNGKRVLITGHTGFKGSWLSIWLSRLGAEVSGYALPAPTDPSLFGLAGVEDLVRHHVADVRDLDNLQRIVAETRPEVIFHLAAQSLVRASLEAPIDTYLTNVIGTAHVLEVARRAADLRAVLIVTSDKCYEKGNSPHGEGDPLGGDDPYSSSKACAELITAAYRTSFFQGSPVAIASVRAGNVIGGGDWARDRLVPDVMTSLLGGRTVRLRHPDAIRPWQHVLDPLHGYLLLAERLMAGEAGFATAWNFGPDASESRDVRRVAETLIREWGSGELEAVSDPGSVETAVLRIDSSRARKCLLWHPRVPVDTALTWAAEWYRDYAAGLPAIDLATRDVERFESLP